MVVSQDALGSWSLRAVGLGEELGAELHLEGEAGGGKTAGIIWVLALLPWPLLGAQAQTPVPPLPSCMTSHKFIPMRFLGQPAQNTTHCNKITHTEAENNGFIVSQI